MKRNDRTSMEFIVAMLPKGSFQTTNTSMVRKNPLVIAIECKSSLNRLFTKKNKRINLEYIHPNNQYKSKRFFIAPLPKVQKRELRSGKGVH